MITRVKKMITISPAMNVAKIFLCAVVLLFMMLAGCTKDEEPRDPYVYTGNEKPGEIPGFGSNIGEFQGHWFKLPAGVEYAGEIRGEGFYGLDSETSPVFGNGSYVKLTIPFINPRNVAVEFPAGMILVPILTDESQKSSGFAENFTVEFPAKPTIHNSIMRASTVANADGCGYSWLPDWANDKIPDLFKPTGGCDGKNYKDPHQAGISPKKGKPVKQWVNKTTPQGSSEISNIKKAPAANDIQYVTLHLYCVNGHESRPSFYTSRFYRPFVTESPLLQWFFKMLEDKNIEDGNASDKIQDFLWKLTDGNEMLSEDDINYIKNLPKE